jgi:REP element-mobilizing transposase RayT
LDGFPLKDFEKDFMLDLIKRFSALYFTGILGFCLMGNHLHLLVEMIPLVHRLAYIGLNPVKGLSGVYSLKRLSDRSYKEE